MKMMFLEISQNSQENTCARVSFLINLQARIPFLTEHLWWLLLQIIFKKFLTHFFMEENLRKSS